MLIKNIAYSSTLDPGLNFVFKISYFSLSVLGGVMGFIFNKKLKILIKSFLLLNNY